ncbi:MAG: hypothetical protein ACRC5C_04160 [Bacilli bacterium]
MYYAMQLTVNVTLKNEGAVDIEHIQIFVGDASKVYKKERKLEVGAAVTLAVANVSKTEQTIGVRFVDGSEEHVVIITDNWSMKHFEDVTVHLTQDETGKWIVK